MNYFTREGFWKRQKVNGKFFCTFCGDEIFRIKGGTGPKIATIDHIIPKSKGGHEGDNLVPACSSCNYRKKSKGFIFLLRELVS